jgi:hypothetical protein
LQFGCVRVIQLRGKDVLQYFQEIQVRFLTSVVFKNL